MNLSTRSYMKRNVIPTMSPINIEPNYLGDLYNKGMFYLQCLLNIEPNYLQLSSQAGELIYDVSYINLRCLY